MPIDKEIKGFIEKYKVTIWGTGDESLDLETEHSRRRLDPVDDGIYSLALKYDEEFTTHDKDTIEVKDGKIVKNESLYQSLRYVIDKFLSDKDDKTDYVDPEGGEFTDTLSFLGKEIEGKFYITFEYEYKGIEMSEIEQRVIDFEEQEKWFSDRS